MSSQVTPPGEVQGLNEAPLAVGKEIKRAGGRNLGKRIMGEIQFLIKGQRNMIIDVSPKGGGGNFHSK